MKKNLQLLFVFFIVLPSLIAKGQNNNTNSVSKSGFFKSLALDPVITLGNKTNSPISQIVINYKIDGGEMHFFEFGGTLPANTTVDIALPRINVKKGMHFFDASVSARNGEPLKNYTFAEGLSFTLSPGKEIKAHNKNAKKNLNENKKKKTGCDCENGKDLDDAISFWFSVFIDDFNKLDAFASTTKGKNWFHGKWDQRSGLENTLNRAVFTDPSNNQRIYRLTISTKSVPENISYSGFIEDKTSDLNLRDFKCKAYPNPFTSIVNVEYNISQIADVEIVISSISGKIVAHPVQAVKHGKGNYTLEYNSGNLPRGVYYCTIQYGNKRHSLKLIKN